MVMHVQVLVLTVIAGVLASNAQEFYYCASVDVVTASGLVNSAQNYFSMKIGEGYSKYAFSVDLSQVNNCDFTLYPTVAYHIHTGTVATSCGDANGHYDPSLACSEKSESHATYCDTLSRTSADAYSYSCSPSGGTTTTTYNTPTAKCEIGDLSGKFGKVTPSSNVVASTQVYSDFLPPYNANFNFATAGFTAGWSSIVFHCGDASGTRIACGNFQLTTGTDDSVTCNYDSNAWVQNESCSDDDDGMQVSDSAYAAILAVLVIGWAVAIALAVFMCFCRGITADNKNLNSSA